MLVFTWANFIFREECCTLKVGTSQSLITFSNTEGNILKIANLCNSLKVAIFCFHAKTPCSSQWSHSVKLMNIMAYEHPPH